MLDANIQMILNHEAGKVVHMSIPQLLMVGLALCIPKLLQEAGYPNPRDAWKNLNDEQREAISTFSNFNVHCVMEGV